MSSDSSKSSLVEGLKYPQYAVRTPFYARYEYTPGEWINYCLTFMRNALAFELEELILEMRTLENDKNTIIKTLQELEVPLYIGIAEECLCNRKNREGKENVHDIVEKALLLEIDHLRHCQAKIKGVLEEVNEKQSTLRSIQHALEEDISRKDCALGIDSTRGISYNAGIEKYDPTITTVQSSTAKRMARSQTERAMSAQLRNEIRTLLHGATKTFVEHWNSTNNALGKRVSEMEEEKKGIHYKLHKVAHEILALGIFMALTKKGINDKLNQWKVVYPRHVSGNFAGEVCFLHRKLLELHVTHQQLLGTKSSLEEDLKHKLEAIFIDQDICMGLRRSFPVSITQFTCFRPIEDRWTRHT